jgi:hypothetical protein
MTSRQSDSNLVQPKPFADVICVEETKDELPEVTPRDIQELVESITQLNMIQNIKQQDQDQQ